MRVGDTAITKNTTQDCTAPASSEQEPDKVPSGFSQDCSVLCVDIDDLQNMSTTSGTSEKEAMADEPVDSDSESKNGDSSSWHPSEDDGTSASGDSPRRPRRGAQSDGNNVTTASRTKRTRKRLYCDSDSSESSSPSSATKESKKSKQQTAATEAEVTSESNPNREEENSGPESDDYCWICHKVGKVRIDLFQLNITDVLSNTYGFNRLIF